MAEDSFKVKCVRAPNEEETPELKEAHDTLTENGFKPLWITPAECLEMEQKDKGSVYMIDPFQGEAFHHLTAIGCRVYGPQCILSCLLLRMEIPRRRAPIYNMAMKDIQVSCTNVDKEIREQIHRKIEYMAGEVSKDFTDNVTHLIAGQVGSKKYVVAGNLGKQIMTSQWVTAVWDIARYRHVHGLDEQFKKYRCPIFLGLVVTVSGLETEERKEIKKSIEAEGGKYTGEMKMKECTHLVIKEAKGQKLAYARKWQIHIVKPRWVYDSMEKGYCLDEADYNVEKDMSRTLDTDRKTSTPDRNKSSVQDSHLGDISCLSNISCINGTISNLQRTRLDSVAEITVDPLESLDVTHIPADLFLDGCKFYLSGFRGPSLEKLRKIINAGGGTRFNTINESVTHVLMGEEIQADINLLKNTDLRPHVVKAAWLVECYKQEKTVDVEPYLALELPALDPTSPKFKGKRKSSMASSTVRTEDADATKNPDDMDDILSQYLPQETETKQEDITAVNIDQQDEVTIGNGGFDEVDGATESDTNNGIFHKKSFIFFGFDEQQVEELAAFIKERGGKVVGENKRLVADYGIVPIDGYPVTVTVNEVLTNVWLQMCIEEEKLLPVDTNELFHPIDMIDNIDELQPLQGSVLSVSGFSGTERDCLMHIAVILGARCQEYFVRRANKGLEASTHLLVKEASGTKYEAAKKWKLPAVSKLWLFACSRTGKREPESKYNIDVISSKSPPPQAPTVPSEPEHVSKGSENTNNIKQTDETVDKAEVKSRPESKNDVEKSQVKSKPESKNEVQKAEVKSKPESKNEVEMAEVESRPEAKNEEIPVPSSSAEESQARPALDPMSGAKSLLVQDKPCKDSQKENRAMNAANTPSRPQHSRIKELQDQPKTPKNFSPSKVGTDTPGKFLDPGVTFAPKYNLAAVQACLQSPAGDENSKHRRRSSVPFNELYGKHVKMAVENSSVKQEDEEENQHSEEINGPLHGVVIAVSKKLLLNQTEYNKIVEDLGGFFSWKQDDRHTHFIFQGRANDTSKEFRLARSQGKFIVSPHWLYTCQEQGKRVDEGQFPHNYNPNLSLAVSGGRTPCRTPGRGSRRTARNPSKSTNEDESKIEQSKAADLAEKQLEEKKKAEKLEEERKAEERKKLEEEREKQEEEQKREEEAAKLEERNMEHDTGGTLEIREELSKQMEAIMNSSGKSKKLPRKKNKRLDSSGQFNTSGNTSDSGRSRPASRQSPWAYPDEKKNASRRTRSSSKSSESNSAPEPSQSVQVTWDDPTGRLEQEKLAQELHAQSQNTDDYMAGIDLSSSNAQFSELEDPAIKEDNTSKTRTSKRRSHESRTPTPEAPPLAFPEPRRASRVMSPQPVEILEEEKAKKKKPPVILVSGMQINERVDYGALVEQLGGKLLDSQHFDPSCTHLVVETPARNEKFLACVAAGKWVLHKSYFEACRNEGTFVKEENHEWGSEATHKIMMKMNAQSSKLAAAAHRWRQKVKEMKKVDPGCGGAFDGWQVILCTDKNRESNFSRLLQAGGATVLPLKPPFESDISATHAFLELNKLKVKLTQEDLENLITANVLCLKPEFIAAQLTDDPSPLPDDFCPPEVTALRASLPDSLSKKRKSSVADSSGKRLRRH